MDMRKNTVITVRSLSHHEDLIIHASMVRTRVYGEVKFLAIADAGAVSHR
jgi:hypothetical protein